MYTLDDYRDKKGFIVIPLKAKDTTKIGGLGICDFCNNASLDGFLIPVLASWYCPKCKEEWEKRSIYYIEDKQYEEKKAISYLKYIILNK